MVSAAPLLVPMVVKVSSTYSISVSHLLKKRLIVLFDVVFLLLNACMVLGGMSHFPRHLEEAVLFGHLKNMGPVVAWALGGGSATSGLTHIYWCQSDHLTLRFMGAHYCMQISISSCGYSSHLILLDL